MRCRSLLVAASCFVGAATSALAQPQYATTPGGATDVNNGGTVVVGSGGTATFRWTISGGAGQYTLIPGGYGGRPHCSADGSVVVSDMQNTVGLGGLPTTSAIAGHWTEGSGWQNLGITKGALSCFDTINTPFDTSADGNISVGLAYTGCDFSSFVPFLANAAAGTMISLSNVGGQGARANCVSTNGLVVAGLDRHPETSTDRPAVWRYDAPSETWIETVLFTAVDPGSEIGSIDAINGDGSILAGFSAEFPGQIARWDWNGATYVASSLGTMSPPSNVPPEAEVGRVSLGGISDDGTVIVGQLVWQIGFFEQYPRAVMWTPSTGLVDLTDHMIAQGIVGLPQNSVLQGCYSLSPDGNVVLGGGFLTDSWMIIRSGGPGCISPVAISGPSTTEISRCTTTTFLNVQTAGSGPFTYQWRREGVPLVDGSTGTGSNITGATTNRMLINGVGPADASSYDCVITNACGSATREPITITMYGAVANDTCETATDVETGTYPIDFCGAYVDTGSATCAGASITDVWFRYPVLFNGELRIRMCDQSYADSVISVYDACGGQELMCNNDFCFGTSTIDRMPVTFGQVLLVRIAVDGNAAYEGSNSVTFIPAPAAPMNDACENATPVGEDIFFFETQEASTDGTASCREGSGRDVWFLYTPADNGHARFETCGSDFDSVLTLFSSCGGAEIACDDNSFDGDCWQHGILRDVPVLRTSPILVRVASGYAFAGGQGVLNIALVPSECTADFNGDGFLNSQDFFDFITAFFTIPAPPSADFNGDGTTNSQDFFDFITAFFSGC